MPKILRKTARSLSASGPEKPLKGCPTTCRPAARGGLQPAAERDGLWEYSQSISLRDRHGAAGGWGLLQLDVLIIGKLAGRTQQRLLDEQVVARGALGRALAQDGGQERL